MYKYEYKKDDEYYYIFVDIFIKSHKYCKELHSLILTECYMHIDQDSIASHLEFDNISINLKNPQSAIIKIKYDFYYFSDLITKNFKII